MADDKMQNYFNYFTEIEERFQQRRGSLLMLSTLDWALIETWREAGLPLAVVLRGIDAAFDKHEARLARARGRTRRINGLAWASQSVMEAAEEAAEAATGIAPAGAAPEPASGFEAVSVAAYLDRIAAQVEATEYAAAIAIRLRELAEAMRTSHPPALEDLDRTLAILEEKMLAGLQAAAPEAELTALREQAERELAPYRGRMKPVQIRQVLAQFQAKRLFEARGLPRLSLFYMPHE